MKHYKVVYNLVQYKPLLKKIIYPKALAAKAKAMGFKAKAKNFRLKAKVSHPWHFEQYFLTDEPAGREMQKTCSTCRQPSIGGRHPMWPWILFTTWCKCKLHHMPQQYCQSICHPHLCIVKWMNMSPGSHIILVFQKIPTGSPSTGTSGGF